MELLSNFFLTLFQGFLLFLISKIILDIKYTLRDYLIILLVIIPSAFLYFYIGSISILYLLIGCGIFLFYKVKWYSIITVLSSSILMFFTNFIAFIVEVLIQKIIYTFVLVDIVHTLTFALISITFAYSLKFLLKKLKHSYLSINKNYLIIISIVLVLSFIILYLYSKVQTVNILSLIHI